MCRYTAVTILLTLLFAGVTPGWCSPIYSSNGIGMVIPDDNGQSKGMGGAGIANDDGKNLLRGNPALLASVKKHTYSIGAVYDRNTAYTGGLESPTFARTTLDLYKIVLHVGKGFVFGWGLSPYSRTESVFEFPHEQFADKMKCSGGINVSSVGFAGSYKDIVRFGVSFNYNFGMIKEEWSRTFYSPDVFHGTIHHIKRKYKGYSTTVGILAHVFNNSSVGVGYTGKANLDMTVHVRPGDLSNPEQIYDNKTASLPASWRFGITSVFRKRFTASMDLSLAQWEKAARTPQEKEMYTNTYRFGAGVRVIPSQSLEASYLKTLPISAGFKFGTLYYKSYPEVKTVFERAVTLGIEFPFQENMASLITSFEFGTRGDKRKNGWDETYTSIGILLFGTIK